MADPDVFVSIQRRGFDHDPRAGHVAAGVLGDDRTVLVPAPPAMVLDPLARLEVLIIPNPLIPTRPIERSPAFCHQDLRAGLAGGQSIVAVLKLTRVSRYGPTVKGFSGPALAAAMAGGASLWTAMETLNLIPPGLSDGPPAAVMDAVPAAERAQTTPAVRVHHHPTPGDVALSLCRLLCICTPGGAL